MRLRARAVNAVYSSLTLAAKSPTVAVVLARLGRYGDPLRNDTEILIEGFPRSGNSFAVAAFRRAQHRPVHIAHHLHAPGHAIAGVRRGVPTLVVIRHPGEAVPEFAASKPNLPVKAILRGYIRFYEPLLAYRSGFVTAPFSDVVGDFGSVVRRVNLRFATSFDALDATPSNVAAVHADVERDYEQRRRSAPGLLQSNDDRLGGDLHERARTEYDRSDLAVLRSRARTIYDDFAGGG